MTERCKPYLYGGHILAREALWELQLPYPASRVGDVHACILRVLQRHRFDMTMVDAGQLSAVTSAGIGLTVVRTCRSRP